MKTVRYEIDAPKRSKRPAELMSFGNGRGEGPKIVWMMF